MSTAVIIGASRGLGLALAEEYASRGWDVVATMRPGGRSNLHELAETMDGGIEIEQVDTNEPGQVGALRERLSGRRIDLLFVNAGVSDGPKQTIAEVSTEAFIRVMVTNALSPMRVVEALQDLVPPTGSIAVMSSGLGSVANNDRGGWEVYRGSKAALNTLMRSFAARHEGDPRSLAVIAPGWVRTDMGGPDADLDAKTSISGVADTLAAHAGQPGLRYLNYRGEMVNW